MALSEVNISLNIQNNRDYPQQINVMGNPANLLDTANATREFRYDVTTFIFTNENSVSIQYKLNGASSFTTFNGILPSKTLQGVVSVLNTLQIGYFNTYTQLGSTYISTYNNNYTFGDINIFSTTSPSYGINTTFVSNTGFNNGTFYSGIFNNYIYISNASASTYNGTPVKSISKINATNGVLDTTFNTGTGANSLIYQLAIQTDGKILAVGAFTTYNGNTASRIVRINTNGTIDSTFVTGTGFNSDVYAVSIQSDGQILVGGTFTQYNGTTTNGLVRLNTDGSIDASLNIGTGFLDIFALNGGVESIGLQSDGKILVGGTYEQFNGVTNNKIIRLNTNGSVDSSFNIGTGFSPFIAGNTLVQTIIVQTDGKVLLGGIFSSYNGTAANNIIRLNTNGSVDSSFVYGTGFTGGTIYLSKIVLQSNGQLVVGGDFAQYNGSNYKNIIRLNTNGSIDTSWIVGSGFTGGAGVQDVEIYLNTIFVIGNFTAFNGTPQGNISNLFI
jgi:uncharacterized delta-60 repeat protein